MSMHPGTEILAQRIDAKQFDGMLDAVSLLFNNRAAFSSVRRWARELCSKPWYLENESWGSGENKNPPRGGNDYQYRARLKCRCGTKTTEHEEDNMPTQLKERKNDAGQAGSQGWTGQRISKRWERRSTDSSAGRRARSTGQTR
jgi:hypothetical protein